jgi:RNA polymerase sigma factor (sigma-70 family)
MDEEERLLGTLLPLSYWMAHHYERQWGQPVGEFETAALMGAWDAVKRYDPESDTSLASYARYRIKGEIVDWHRREMQQKGGSRKEHLRRYTYCVDFNDLSKNDDGYYSDASIIEQMEQGRTTEHGYKDIDDHDMLMHLKQRMDEREWDIMVRCVCNEETMKDIGKDYGVSESRICQILPVALYHARRIIEKMDIPKESHDMGMDMEDLKEAQWMRRNSEKGLRPEAS